MAYVPNRDDIIHLQFDPASGREIKEPHFGLVVSSKLFNRDFPLGFEMITRLFLRVFSVD